MSDEIDKGVTVEKTVVLGETHYKSLLAKNDTLMDIITAARRGIDEINMSSLKPQTTKEDMARELRALIGKLYLMGKNL